VQSIIATQAAYEFRPSFARGLTIAAYVGMLVGAIFWGLSADIVGRKFAFNTSLMICSVFAIVAGASPNWFVLGLFVCLSAFGSGDDALFPGKGRDGRTNRYQAETLSLTRRSSWSTSLVRTNGF